MQINRIYSLSFYRYGVNRAFLVLLFLVYSSLSQAQNLDLQPSASLTPTEVVDFQLTALKNVENGGIEATFRFASPANKKVTGPLSKFSGLFESEQYKPMLNHRGTEIKTVSNDGYTAELLAGVVDQSGDLHWYRFRLSRQQEAPFKNCWMTDAVMAVPHSGRSA